MKDQTEPKQREPSVWREMDNVLATIKLLEEASLNLSDRLKNVRHMSAEGKSEVASIEVPVCDLTDRLKQYNDRLGDVSNTLIVILSELEI